MNVLDSFRLNDKVAIVTGASSGLGVGFAAALAEAGADLSLAARRVDRLVDVAASVEATDRRALLRGTDVSRPEDCIALVEATVEAFGRVDVLVNNAGVSTASPPPARTRLSSGASLTSISTVPTGWRRHADGL
jgi:NADP-dependent 3-hydroxy acid dehydrogenase YdfG